MKTVDFKAVSQQSGEMQNFVALLGQSDFRERFPMTSRILSSKKTEANQSVQGLTGQVTVRVLSIQRIENQLQLLLGVLYSIPPLDGYCLENYQVLYEQVLVHSSKNTLFTGNFSVVSIKIDAPYAKSLIKMDFYRVSNDAIRTCYAELLLPLSDFETEEPYSYKIVHPVQKSGHLASDPFINIYYYNGTTSLIDYQNTNRDPQVTLPSEGRIELVNQTVKTYPLPTYLLILKNGEQVVTKSVKLTLSGKKVSWKTENDKWDMPAYDFNEGKCTVYADYSLSMHVTLSNNKKLALLVTNIFSGNPSDIPTEGGPDKYPFVKVRKIKSIRGCLRKDADVWMADGTYKKIQDIKPGDKVRSDNNRLSTVRNTFKGLHNTAWVHIELDNGYQVYTTPEHPFLTDAGFLIAGLITEGASLKTAEGSFHQVTTICSLFTDDTEAFNLELDGADNFIADKLVVGDFNAQQHYHRVQTDPRFQIDEKWLVDYDSFCQMLK